MRTLLVVLVLTLPGLAFGQSLADVAKKEKERREKNKEKGKEVHVISESELEATRPAEETQVASGGESESAATSPSSSTSSSSSEMATYSESSEDEGSVPKFIPPDRPLPEKLAMFDQMKRHYQSQVEEIDKQIAENDAKLKKIESELAATSALGGAGLPVAPQTGTGAATRPMTGQESAALVGEQTRLQTMNQQLQQRKETLKMDLQAKGRSAGIPAGYLRF